MASALVVKESEIKNTLKSVVTLKNEDCSMDVVALWDTGATNSCIAMDVVAGLSLISTGKIPMSTPSGSRIADTYLLDVVLPKDVHIDDLMVCDSEIGDQGIGMLIGMDIITKGDFAVSNYDGKTVFTFRVPSIALTDYVAQIRKQNIIGERHGKGKRKRKKT